MKVLKELTQSKKAIVYVVTAAVMAVVMFAGLDPVAVADFTDKLYMLAMAYLGGQGLADLGKYAGEAYASGKKVVVSQGGAPDREAAAAVALAVGERAAEVIEEAGE